MRHFELVTNLPPNMIYTGVWDTHPEVPEACTLALLFLGSMLITWFFVRKNRKGRNG